MSRRSASCRLGCPKALVDSEQIITQLRAEGYEISGTYDGADLVVVNTCGFIDEAVQESLDAIGEALSENGKVIVTGCLGAKKSASGSGLIEEVHPKVLAVTGPHALDEVMQHVHTHLPKPHDPFVDLVPAAGVKLTPRHYAYLKISEGCNHRCTFCIIPSMRGDLVSRPVAEVMLEAENLFKSGVKELLVISQDTSAYGVDVKYRTGFWNGKPIKTRMTDLVGALGELAAQYGAWVRLHYVYPYPSVDEVIPMMAEGPLQGSRAAVSRRAVPARASRSAEAHEAPGQRREGARAREGVARNLPGSDDPQHVHRGLSGRDRRAVPDAARLHPRGGSGSRRLLRVLAGRRRDRERTRRRAARRSARGTPRALHGSGRGSVGEAHGEEGRQDAEGAGRRSQRRRRHRPHGGGCAGDRRRRVHRAGRRRRRSATRSAISCR